MSTITRIIVTCDQCPEESDVEEADLFGITVGGKQYEVDLCEEHAALLLALVEVARPVKRTYTRRTAV